VICVGTGGSKQLQLADVMIRHRKSFPFEFVLMLGDNMYGGEDPNDFVKKFEEPYKDLLASGVKFYAVLGNHNTPAQRFYKHFNMAGKEYYSFKSGNVRFFALNSCYMDPQQLKWLEEELKKSQAEWKICFFHHPLYSSGKKHGPDDDLRKVIEPLFVKYGVSAVFSGHEHFYERFKPQKGIYYFISGAGGKLRQGGVNDTSLTEKFFDKDQHFILAEVVDDSMYFHVITGSGNIVDQGILKLLRRNGSESMRPVSQ
jgi:3',5'-cyclic AMP phosphodiesterase CpdA